MKPEEINNSYIITYGFTDGSIIEVKVIPQQDRISIGEPCRGCSEPLKEENKWMEDGCPCNSKKGVNNK